MTIAYLNNEYVPLEEARVSVLDRGFLFADGVYEVIPVYGGRLFRLDEHLQRLQNSLDGIRLENPLSQSQWQTVLRRVVADNGGGEQSVYLQVTRGAAAIREHAFQKNVQATVFVMSTPLRSPSNDLLESGAKLIIMQDIRWQYCHLKTIALLPNVLMQQAAKEQGVDEAILIRDGNATECTASNFFLVKDQLIITPPKSDQLLPGITRDLLLELAQQHAMPYEERTVAEAELHTADEIWISSSSKEVVPVTRLNDKPVGNGVPGECWRQMLMHYQAYKQQLILGAAN